MRLVGFLLGLAILCLLATQLSFGLQQQVAIKRKNSEGDEKKELAISDTLGLTEQEKELEKEILSSKVVVVKPVAKVETDTKKAKKAKKLKKLKKQKKRLAALRKLALQRQAEQRKRQAEQKKRQQERKEARGENYICRFPSPAFSTKLGVYLLLF